MDGAVAVSLSSCAFSLLVTPPVLLSRYVGTLATTGLCSIVPFCKLSIHTTVMSHTGTQCPYLSLNFPLARIRFKPLLIINSGCNIHPSLGSHQLQPKSTATLLRAYREVQNHCQLEWLPSSTPSTYSAFCLFQLPVGFSASHRQFIEDKAL